MKHTKLVIRLDDSDPLSPAEGAINGILIGAALWLLIFIIGKMVL